MTLLAAMPMGDLPDDSNEQALEAVASLIAQVDPGAMVQKFVLIAEVYDANGKRAVWNFTSPDAQAQDSLGLLLHGIHEEQAESVARRLEDD